MTHLALAVLLSAALVTHPSPVTTSTYSALTAHEAQRRQCHLPGSGCQGQVENQLIRIDLPSGGVATYRYDALGRRIEKNVSGTIQRFVYDQEDLVSVYETTGCWQTTFLHGPGLDQPLALIHDDSGDCNCTTAVGLRRNLFYFIWL